MPMTDQYSFTILERMPRHELLWRWDRCRAQLAALRPEAGGLMAFSRLNIYYLSGCAVQGVFWLPLEGEPVIMVRRGLERVQLESAVALQRTFRSYGDIPGILSDAGHRLPVDVAAEMGGLSWELGRTLGNRLANIRFVPSDEVLLRTRAVKSEWELAKMRLGGARQDLCLQQDLPGMISPGMTEREIALKVWEAYFARGHQGLMRMGNYGEEIFLGHVAAGDSANYPSVFNGPVGLRGAHPAVTQMGYAGKVWLPGEPLAIDAGFALEGYSLDKTQVYFAGSHRDIPDRARRGHEFCKRVQSWLADQLVPGAVPAELYDRVVQWAEKEGWSEGFMALTGNKVVFLGHGIGLAIDEWPVLARGFDQPLEAGTTLALEPKMGVAGLGMVGVENTFVVTEQGGECLTGDVFDIICVE